MRELRQRASELLRRVASGETIEVTDRGHRPRAAGGVTAAISTQEIGADLARVVTYDERMAAAAGVMGYSVAAPA